MTSISMKWSLTAATFGLLLCDFEHFGNNEREGIVEGGGDRALLALLALS